MKVQAGGGNDHLRISLTFIDISGETRIVFSQIFFFNSKLLLVTRLHTHSGKKTGVIKLSLASVSKILLTKNTFPSENFKPTGVKIISKLQTGRFQHYTIDKTNV